MENEDYPSLLHGLKKSEEIARQESTQMLNLQHWVAIA